MHRIHNIIQLAINDSDFKFYIQRQNYQQLYADIRIFIGGCEFRVLVIIKLSYFICRPSIRKRNIFRISFDIQQVY